MHILVMTRSTLSHGFGGFQRQCVDLCEGFVRLGHRVTVLTTVHPNGIESEEEDGYMVHYVSPSKPRRLSSGWFKATRKKVEEIHATDSIDVIHSNEFAGFGLLGWAKRNDVPISLLCHGSLRSELLSFWASADMRPRYWHWLILTPTYLIKRYFFWELKMRRAAKSILLVTPTIAHDFRLFCGDKVKVIENGIALPEKPEPKRNEGTLTLLCTGRMDRQKGFQMAVKALGELRELDLSLEIVGSGAYLVELQALIDELQLADRVTLHGRVSDEELARIYSSADVYLIPTLRYEGLPLALLEALGHGIPTISSRIGGNADVLTHGEDGLFVKAGDLRLLVDSIRLLATEPETRHRLAEAARQTAERRFDKERMVAETEAVLRAISDN
jgi:glycosyltransferase involved in cell wall biosynthesis|tara:strand:- start:154 stop:1314 length:1161 start_codon:yes stop_codon:yes gene_type:complete